MALAQDRWVKNLRCRSQQVEWHAMAWATNGRRFFLLRLFYGWAKKDEEQGEVFFF